MKKSGIPIIVHLILLGIILVIAIVSIVLFVRWNKGKASGYDPNAVNTDFDVETEDYDMPLNPDYLKGHKDDGVNTILLLGNAPISDARDKNSLGSYLAKDLKATVINCGFSNTFMSEKDINYDVSYGNDAFSLYWLTKCITLQDFTLLDNAVATYKGKDNDFDETLKTLKNVDMDKVDTIVIMYDGSDYKEGRMITDPANSINVGACSNSLEGAIELIQKAYPYIRIVVSSQPFALIEKDGSLKSGATHNNGFGMLSDYMIACKNIAVDQDVTFVDNYGGSITEDNYKDYLEKDGIHLNEKGRELIAKRIASFLK